MTWSPFRHLGSIVRKTRPIQLTFFLTGRCNARCPFCFYLSTDSVRSAAAPELTLGEIERMASSLGDLLWLAFSGGEIFLRRDLVDVVKTFYRHNRPAIILLPTNGLLPEIIRRNTEAILTACPRSVVTVKLSLDGPEELHDRLRGVAGAYRKTLETYEMLAPLVGRFANFELGINTVFCAANQDHMEEIIDFVGTLEQVGTHTVSLVRGEVGDARLKDVDLEKYRETIALLAANLRSRQAPVYRFHGGRLKAAQDIVQRRLIRRARLERRQVIPCCAGRLTLVVTEAGEVFPCEAFSRKLGNVRENDYDLNRILGSAPAREAVAAIRRRQCWCTHECYMMMNVLFQPEAYPALLREYLRCLIPL